METITLAHQSSKSVAVPTHIDATRMTREQFVDHIAAGYEDFLAGRVIPFEEAFAHLEENILHGEL